MRSGAVPLQGLGKSSHKPTIAAMEKPIPTLMRPGPAAARYGISRRTLARLQQADPAFPRPVRLSKRMVLHRCAELDAYFTAKQQEPIDD